jgi:hypothetical protein
MNTTRITFIGGGHISVKGTVDEVHDQLIGSGYRQVEDRHGDMAWINADAIAYFSHESGDRPRIEPAS